MKFNYIFNVREQLLLLYIMYFNLYYHLIQQIIYFNDENILNKIF